MERIKRRFLNEELAVIIFSETHGTLFFGLNTPIEEVCRTLALIPEKGSIRGAARISGHDKSSIC